jgi:hypothetical protein
VKLEFQLEEGVIESLESLKFLLEEKMVEPLVSLKHVEGMNSPWVGSLVFLLQTVSRR